MKGLIRTKDKAVFVGLCDKCAWRMRIIAVNGKGMIIFQRYSGLIVSRTGDWKRVMEVPTIKYNFGQGRYVVQVEGFFTTVGWEW